MEDKVILYFIDGPNASDEDVKAARALGAKLRNAQLVDRLDEKADAVAGAVPEAYKDVPRADAKDDGKKGEEVPPPDAHGKKHK